MPQDAPPNGGAHDDAPGGSWSRVAGMQAKLHRWAVADPGRRFGDLFNFVHDPATLVVAYSRVAGNRGANTPGVDGMTVALVGERIGVPEFLDGLRAQLKAGTFRPLQVRERKIPKPGGSGKLRKLGIPAVADKVVQAALKLVLEPIAISAYRGPGWSIDRCCRSYGCWRQMPTSTMTGAAVRARFPSAGIAAAVMPLWHRAVFADRFLRGPAVRVARTSWWHGRRILRA